MVGQPAADQHACECAEDEQSQDPCGRRLIGVVMAANEEDGERLQPGEEEVAERRGNDHRDVRLDAQHVAHGSLERHLRRVLGQHEREICLDPVAAHRVEREVVLADRLIGVLAGPVGSALAPRGREQIDSAVLEPALAAAAWLGQGTPQFPGKEEAGDRDHPEGEPPRQHAGDQAADDEAHRGPRDLATEDVAVHATSLASVEVVTGE